MNVINRIKPIWKYSFLLVVLALTAFGTFQVLSKSLHAARSDSRDEPTPGNPESSIDASGLEARIVFNTTGSESDDDPTGGSRPEDTLVNFELHVDSSVAQIEDSKHKSSDEPLCGSPRRKDEGNPQIHNEDYKVLIKRIGDLEQLAETALRSYSELEKKHTQLVAATRKFREHTLQVEKDLRQKINSSGNVVPTSAERPAGRDEAVSILEQQSIAKPAEEDLKVIRDASQMGSSRLQDRLNGNWKLRVNVEHLVNAHRTQPVNWVIDYGVNLKVSPDGNVSGRLFSAAEVKKDRGFAPTGSNAPISGTLSPTGELTLVVGDVRIGPNSIFRLNESNGKLTGKLEAGIVSSKWNCYVGPAEGSRER